MEKIIDVKEQPALSFARTASIALEGVKYRLFRSIVTVGVIAVAVAFLMNILSKSVITRSVVEDTRLRIKEIRADATWVTKITTPDTTASLLGSLAREIMASKRGLEDDIIRKQAVQFGSLTASEQEALFKGSEDYYRFSKFFTDLDYSRQRKLVRSNKGLQVFDFLQTKAGFGRYSDALETIKSIRITWEEGALEDFLSRWDNIKMLAARVTEGHKKAVGQVNAKYKDQSRIELLRDAKGAFGNDLRKYGFLLDAKAAELIAKMASQSVDRVNLELTLGDEKIKQNLARRLTEQPKLINISHMWEVLDSEDGAAWYISELKKRKLEAASLPVARLVELAEARAEDIQLSRITVDDEEIGSSGMLGLGKQMGWLVILSMLVCVVGITNAMLMSVTERFREIATLKCLGALDFFIMLVFVLEAGLLGVAGGAVGAVLGTVLGSILSLLSYGSLALSSLPIGELTLWMIIAVIVGVVLAAFAALYPSYKAARLAPMEAMRIE